MLPASAARPRAGSWSGRTAQGASIVFRVTAGRNRIKDLRVGFSAPCASGVTDLTGPFPIRDARFRVRAGETTVRGTFEKKQAVAHGTVRWRGRSYSPSGSSRSCDSGLVSWTAKRR